MRSQEAGADMGSMHDVSEPIQLARLWSALEDQPRLSSIATSRLGIEYEPVVRQHRTEWLSSKPAAGFRPGVQSDSRSFEPFFLGKHVYLNMNPRLIRGKGYLHPWNAPKVLVRRIRQTRGAWSLVAVPDYSGLVADASFHGVWPTANIPVEVIAAILNGYVANAYVSFVAEKRTSGRAPVDEVPIPVLSESLNRQLTDLVSLYRIHRAELQMGSSQERAARCLELLEEIAALVLAAYRLPSPLERELLVYFSGGPRPELDVLRRNNGVPTGTTISLPLDETDFEAAPPPHGSIEQADAEFEAGLLRLAGTVRSTHPELFDESGELRMEDALRLLARRTSGKKVLSRAELLALTGQGDGLPPDAT